MTPARKTTGRVAFVGSGPGDAGLLTVRAQELLAKAEVVVTDPDVPAGVLAFASADAEVQQRQHDADGENEKESAAAATTASIATPGPGLGTFLRRHLFFGA